MSVAFEAALNVGALPVPTCNDIIRMAMSRLRQLRTGEVPTAAEAADGMVTLQAMYDNWVATGLFGRLNDIIPSAAYTAQEQDRVINDGGYVITLPASIIATAPMGTYAPRYPDERIWSALQTNVPRPPRDYSIIEVLEGGATKRFFYSAHLRSWVRLDSLLLTSGAPLAGRGSAGLASCLAELMADEYGVDAPPGVKRQSMLFRWALSSKYGSTRVANMTDFF
jgi:hypothetical protein